MNEIIRLPKWGDDMTEGEIGEWHVRCGDYVAKGDPLVTIEIEKTSVEIESTVSGTVVSTESEVGEIIPVGSVIARIETDEG